MPRVYATGPDTFPGARFARLVIIERADNPKKDGARWLCRCDCGGEKVVYGTNLRSGMAKSCGCLPRGAVKTHGMTNAPEYAAWEAARYRCRNPKCAEYPAYGGRGIRVCDRWDTSFEAFYADMGPRPSAGHSIDRIDGDGDYEPGNCRWATAEEQSNNRRDYNRRIVVDGEVMTVGQASRLLGVPKTTIYTRLDRGVPEHLAHLPAETDGRFKSGSA